MSKFMFNEMALEYGLQQKNKLVYNQYGHGIYRMEFVDGRSYYGMSEAAKYSIRARTSFELT